ncbi:MAG: DUF192 domain-containing protein [Candidatus Diapherotrites archaeon]
MMRKIILLGASVLLIIIALIILGILLTTPIERTSTEHLPIISTISSPSLLCFSSCVSLEIASTPDEKERGLMFRYSLDENAGMLFVFDSLDVYSFWMKNTLIPLDGIWLDDQYRVVDILHMLPCAEDSCPFYTPSDKARYVLEVNAGWAEKNNVKIGDAAHCTSGE